jgi:hypothetical protein
MVWLSRVQDVQYKRSSWLRDTRISCLVCLVLNVRRRSLFFNCQPPTLLPLAFSVHCAVTLTMQWCHGSYWRHNSSDVIGVALGGGAGIIMTSRTHTAIQIFVFSLVGETISPKAVSRPWPWHARSKTVQSCETLLCLFTSFFFFKPLSVNRLWRWGNAAWVWIVHCT